VNRDEARTRVLNTLNFFNNHAPCEHGWFDHWMNVKTGERTGVLQQSKQKSELWSIDTGLLLATIFTASQYFHKDPAIHRLATAICRKRRW
jgi:hypothetical protein